MVGHRQRGCKGYPGDITLCQTQEIVTHRLANDDRGAETNEVATQQESLFLLQKSVWDGSTTSGTERDTYLVGIVILPDPEPQSTGILSYFQPKALTCQYRYIMVYELLQQSETFSYNHWRVHILSFKNICGYSVSYITESLPILDTLAAIFCRPLGFSNDNLCFSEIIYARNGSLSVASVKPKGGKWKIVQTTVSAWMLMLCKLS